MKNLYYLRDDATGKITTTDDIIEWGKAFGSSNRAIMLTDIGSDIRVSTVFLGINHNFFAGYPVLFETMVFGGTLDGEQERYQTEEQAWSGHVVMLQRVIDAMGVQ